jgi:extradiol dioxygenase family protein
MLPPFHLACHVTSLDEARTFCGGIPRCREGRSTETRVDFDVFGHQIRPHPGEPFATTNTGRVGDRLVPMPHPGLVLLQPDWQAPADRLTGSNVAFVLPPQVRFRGPAGRTVDDVPS